ncbi:unnamed protein product, partial [Phaeothamnion confervicola]
LFSRTGPPRLEPISLSEAQALHNALWIDARNGEEYKEGHIPRAVNLPLMEALRGNIPGTITGSTSDLIIYCDGPGCGASDKLAEILHHRVAGRIKVFTGGYPEWKKAGLVVKPGVEP